MSNYFSLQHNKQQDSVKVAAHRN